MKVRHATAEDAPALVEILGEAAAMRSVVARLPEEVPSASTQAERLAELVRRGGGALVAEDAAGLVVGHLILHRGERLARRHVAELGLVVRASHRGRGVGRALLMEGEAWARAHGVRKLALSVFSDNAPARALYASMGYVEEGVLRGQSLLDGVPKDEVLMAKWVA